MSNDKLTSEFDKSYQKRLINQIIMEQKFASVILPIIDPLYFDDEIIKLIIRTLIDAYVKDDTVLNFETLTTRVLSHRAFNTPIKKERLVKLIEEIRTIDSNDFTYVRERAITFCKQQELRKAAKKVLKIADSDNPEAYYECESIIKDALEKGNEDDNGIDVAHNLENVLSEDFRDPIPTGIKGLDECMGGGLSKKEVALVIAPSGVGKAQPLFSKVLTPNGWTTMGEIKVGDKVITQSGEETNVIGVYPQGKRPIYKVSFNDGTSTLCDEEHLWAVNTINQRNRKTSKNGKVIYLPKDNSFKTMKTKDMISSVRKWGGVLNYKVPIVEPVNFVEQELNVDPYLLGLLLGDGSFTKGNHVTLTTNDQEIIESIITINRDVSVTLHERRDNGNKLNYVYLNGDIKDRLKELELYGCDSKTKFIPNEFLINSVENRVSLLQGLMDSDGYSNEHRLEYSTVSKTMAESVVELIKSLGGRTKMILRTGKYKKDGKVVECSEYYRISFSLPDNGIKPFRLTRKLETFNPRTKYSNNKFINAIEYYGEEDAQCIMVDDDSHLYVTDDYIVTHNTTLTTKIANEAFNAGKNVVQLFFEDTEEQIQRKHYTCWTGIESKDLFSRRDDVIKTVKEKTDRQNKLILLKLPSFGTTMRSINQALKKIIANGTPIDMVILDYIDCVQADKSAKDVHEAEGLSMRQFETMVSELNIAGWVATQGNRDSMSAEIVQASQTGGSIKKVQIGHFVMSIAKTLEQREEGVANIAILKSRFGKDGVTFNDCVFDNATMTIDTNANAMGYGDWQQAKATQVQNTIINALK